MRTCYKKNAVIAIGLLAALLFWSCSSGIEEPVEPGDVHYEYRGNWHINGSLRFLPTMKIEDVKIVLLDRNCKAKDTLHPSFDSTGFKVDSFKLNQPYLKVVTEVSSDSTLSKNMEFVQYVDSSLSRNIFVNIMAAVSSKAMEEAICKEHLSYFDASNKVYRTTGRFFGNNDINPAVYDWADYGDGDIDAYIFGRYFISDSVFYSDYKKIAKAIVKGETDDSLYRTRAADDLLKYFVNYRWEGVRGMYALRAGWVGWTRVDEYYVDTNVFMNFWERAYGFRQCDEILLGDTVVNRVRGSAFNGSTFICDAPHRIDENKDFHWRLMDADERKLGPCLYTTKDYVENDSLYYRCGDYRWEQVTDPTTVLNLAYKTCDRIRERRLTLYRDTVYLCYRDDEKFIWTADTAIIKKQYPIAESCIRTLTQPCVDEDQKMICGTFYNCVEGEWYL